jgi:hypothetical protein
MFKDRVLNEEKHNKFVAAIEDSKEDEARAIMMNDMSEDEAMATWLKFISTPENKKIALTWQSNVEFSNFIRECFCK